MTLPRSSRSRAKARAKAAEPGRAEWKTPPPNGPCHGCERRGPRIRHHVVTEQRVRREGGDPWDQANAMLLGQHFVCDCHAHHHEPSGRRRLPFAKVPPAARDFAVQLLGRNGAAAYFRKHYRQEEQDAGA